MLFCLDNGLINTVDRLSRNLHVSRSAFARTALKDAVKKYHVRQLESKHRKGYEKNPVQDAEFGVWEKEQAWGDR